MGKHEMLEQKMCKELDTIAERYTGNAEMTEADVKKIDLLAHALKSLATYDAMRGGGGYGGGQVHGYGRGMGPQGYSGEHPWYQGWEPRW